MRTYVVGAIFTASIVIANGGVARAGGHGVGGGGGSHASGGGGSHSSSSSGGGGSHSSGGGSHSSSFHGTSGGSSGGVHDHRSNPGGWSGGSHTYRPSGGGSVPSGADRDHRTGTSGTGGVVVGRPGTGYVGGGATYVDGGATYVDGGAYYTDGGPYVGGDATEACPSEDGCPRTAPMAWQWEVGYLSRRFSAPAYSHAGSIDYLDSAYAYTLSSPSAPGNAAAGALDVRALVTTSPHVYLGAETQVGELTRSPVVLNAQSGTGVDMTTFGIGRTTAWGLAGVAGVRMRSGPFELGGEAAAGFHAYTTVIETYDYGIDMGEGTSDTNAAAMLETRLRAVVWIAPTWSISAQAGASVLDRHDVSIAFMLGNASQPYAESSPY